MSPCPRCQVPLDNEGICTKCGALALGFSRIAPLGADQIADAAARGLDFYRLLDITPQADIPAIARCYRHLRARFPDTLTNLQSPLIQRLTLLEVAGRVLTDPRLRQIYDEIRAKPPAQDTAGVTRCVTCAAFLSQPECPYCGTARPPQTPAPTIAPSPPTRPESIEPIDYYAVLGLSPTHLHFQAPSTVKGGLITAGVVLTQATLRVAGVRLPVRVRVNMPSPEFARPPGPREIDAAAETMLLQIMSMRDLAPDEQVSLTDAIAVARHILRDNRLRGVYDLLLIDFQQGKTAHGQLDTLYHLQTDAREAIGAVRGDAMTAEQIDALLQQAHTCLDAGTWHQARDMFKDVIHAWPDSIAAHAGLVRAIVHADDLLVSGPYPLSLALDSLSALERLNATPDNAPALIALLKGLLARDAGDVPTAEAALQQAITYDRQLILAWRGLAVLALARGAIDACVTACQGALATAPHNEPILTLLLGAYLRAKQRTQAHDVADQIAKNRGNGWTAQAVLHEMSP